jgi:hypothetical protein
MGFWGSGFLSDWKNAVENFGGTVGNGFGAVMDLAGLQQQSGTYDPNTNTYSNTDWDRTLQDLGKTLHDVKGGTGWAGDAVATTMKVDQGIYSDWISRPLSTLMLVGDYSDPGSQFQKNHPGTSWGMGLGTLLSGDAWDSAWKQAQHTSPGQALVGGFAGDLSDPHEIDDLKRHWWFSLLSGSTDATMSFMLDPLGKLGKVAKLGRVGKTTESLDNVLTRMGDHPSTAADLESSTSAVPGVDAIPVGSPLPTRPGRLASLLPESPQGTVVGSGPMQKALDWMQTQSNKFDKPVEAAKAIRQHPVLRDAPNSGLIAGIMADSNREQKELVMRVALNDAPAALALKQTRADIFERLALLTDSQNTLIQRYAKLDGSGLVPDTMDRATDDAALSRMSDEISALETQRGLIDDLIGRAPEENPVNVEGAVDQGNRADIGIQGAVTQVPKGIAPGLGASAVAGALPGAAGQLASKLVPAVQHATPQAATDASGAINASLAKAAATVRSGVDAATQRYGARISQNVFYYNAFNTPLRIIGATNNFFNGRRPQGWVDMNDPDGWRDLDDMLRRVKGFDPAQRNQLVSRFMRATGETDKLNISIEAERAAFAHIGAGQGIGPDDMGRVFGEFLSQRDKARAMVVNRAYTGTKGLDGKVRIDGIGDDNAAMVIAPQLAEQLANAYPLADMDLAQKAISNSGNRLKMMLRQGPGVVPGSDALTNLGDVLSPMWKIANFMRLGYLTRVLSDDEMAYIAKLGAMTALKPIGRGAANFAANQWSRAQMFATRRILGHGDMGKFQPRRIGDQPITIKGRDPATGQVTSYEAAGAFPSTPMGKYWRGLASEDRTTMDMDEGARLGAMRRTHNYGLIDQGDDTYLESWADALNNQLGSSPLTRQLLDGRDEREVVQWLKATPEGRSYAARMKIRSWDPQGWVADLHRWVDDYAPTDEIKQAALRRDAGKDLLGQIDLRTAPQQVHGPLLDFAMGQGAWAKKYEDFQRGFYKVMNQAPTDVLVRHPYASAVYKTRLQELANSWTASGGEITGDVLAGFENQARKYAIQDVNSIVLDLSRHSNAAHVFRFIAPFYNAWQQALTRWGRLAYADPEIIFKGNKLWQGSNNIPLMFDPNGDVQDQNGKKISGGSQGYTGLANAENQLLTFRLPRSIAKRLGATTLDNVQIPKSTLNLVLQGDPWYLPGFGPLVQLPASKIVEANPQYLNDFKAILPYGPQDFKSSILPTSIRKYNDTADDSQTAVSTQINIYRTRFAAWLENGGTGRMPQPDDPDIMTDAAHMMKLRFATQLVSPVNIRFNSPDKFYTDAFHKIQANAKEIRNADGSVTPASDVAMNEFMSKYPNYFMFADSISKNNSGIPPTVDALIAQRKYKDVLAKAPDVASAIIGPAMALNGGDTGSSFNSAIYKAQFNERLSPIDSTPMRQYRSLKEFSQSSLAGLGWYIFNLANEKIRVELANRGLVSTTQNGASDLATAKRNLEGNLASILPQWGQEFTSFDQVEERTYHQPVDAGGDG